jgi:PilZ domain
VTLRIRVSAPTERGEEFLTEGRTVDVSHDGAAIIVDRDLRVGQTVKIHRVGVPKEAEARVVGPHGEDRSGARVFGIALTETNSNLWDIVFPPAAEPGKAVLRALLRCVACGRLEVCYLNEFESDLFLNHHSVARLCGQCGGWTTWTRPYAGVPASSEDYEACNPSESAPASQNHRLHERLRTEAVGCIRDAARGNEVVLVSSLARGGLSFLSSNEFPEGAAIEMAIPYTSKAPNIYSLVRVVGARKGRHGHLTEYRAAYMV